MYQLQIPAKHLEFLMRPLHFEKYPLLQPPKYPSPHPSFLIIYCVALFQGNSRNCHVSSYHSKSIYPLSEKIPKSPPNRFKMAVVEVQIRIGVRVENSLKSNIHIVRRVIGAAKNANQDLANNQGN